MTPEDRHVGREGAILAQRHAIYTQARERAPARRSGPTRDRSPVATVRLNPDREIASVPEDVAA